jgi:hypothetical protein
MARNLLSIFMWRLVKTSQNPPRTEHPGIWYALPDGG